MAEDPVARRPILLLAILAACAGIYAMLVSVGAREIPVPDVAKQADVGHRMAAERAGAVGGGADVGLEREMLESATPREPPTGVRLVVVDGDTGEPVAGAEVAYCDVTYARRIPEEQQAEHRRLVALGDLERITRLYGGRVIADVRGIAVLPVDGYAYVTARRGERYGQALIRFGSTRGTVEHRLELARDLTLVVRVETARGLPVGGVPVQVVPRFEASRGDRPFDAGASAEGTGLLEVPRLPRVLARWVDGDRRPVGHELRADIPGRDAVGVSFDGAAPGPGPVVLRLPATGRVVVRILDRAGEPVPSEAIEEIGLSQWTAEAPGRTDPPVPRWEGARDATGVITFPHVVADRRYRVGARIGGVFVERVFQGPAHEGDEVEVTLRSETDLYFVSGRLLGVGGQAVGGERLEARLITGDGRRLTRGVVPGRDGRFRMLITADARPGPLSVRSLEFADRPGRVGSLREFSIGDRILQPGDNELGDITLAAPPLVVAGFLFVDGRITEGPLPRLGVEHLEVLPIRDSSRVRWRDAGLDVRFPKPGRFEVRGVALPGRHRITIRSGPYRPVEPIEFAVGAVDLRIDLESGGGREGR